MKYLLLTLILFTQSLFALISITPVEIGTKAGVHGFTELSLQTQRGNTDKDNYQGALKVIYDNNTTFVTWVEISAKYGETNKVEDTNNAYLHFRYIYALSPEYLRVELFTQLQKDKFQLIKHKEINGLGLRVQLSHIFNSGNGYFGIGGFSEAINYSDNTYKHNIRLNSYLTYQMQINEKSELSYSFYYQPLYNNLSNTVTTHAFALKVEIYKELFLQLKATYNLDTTPAVSVKKENFTQNTSFIFNF